MSNRDPDSHQLPLWPTGNQEKAHKTQNMMNHLPDVRDGLTREQRVILYVLHEAQKERGNRNVPTLMLYGRVCEHIPMGRERFIALLSNLVGRGVPPF